MEIRAHGLDLRIAPIGEPDAHHFLHVRVSVTVPTFSGEYEASIEPQEFIQFARGLENLDTHLTPGDTAVLEPVEHDFSVKLTMATAGHIRGEYRFQGGRFDGIQPTVLSGAFQMDQSYLPDLRSQVAGILDVLGVSRSL